MAAKAARFGLRGLAGMALAVTLGCLPVGGYGGGARYPEPAPKPESEAPPGPALLSAHLSAWGEEVEPLAEATQARRVEGGEHTLDRIVLVFRHELDATSVDARAFAISRGDGRRVRPVRALLAPADEGDENRSLTLLGNFGGPDSPPVAIHVIGLLYAESGEELRGLDAQISGPDQPDGVVLVERLAAAERRCAGARQVVRAYWSDQLGPSDEALLAKIELRLADGQTTHPVGLDDQRVETDTDTPAPLPGTGRADDNVLDLCVDRDAPVVHLHIAAGALRDADGHPSAVVDVALEPGSLPAADEPTQAVTAQFEEP